MRRFVAATSLAGLCILGAGTGALRAASRTPETDPLNHAYAVYLGSGLYVSEGRSVLVFRVAPKVRLRSEEEHPLGLRLRFNATFGFYDLDVGDLVDLEFPDRLATFALVPGIEFPVRLRENWTLRPFLDFGAATDTVLQDSTLVLGAGAESRAEFHDRRRDYLLWNELVYAKNLDTSVNASEDYTLLRTDLEVRGLLRYRLGRRAFDLGLLAELDWYFDTVIVNLPRDERAEIGERYQLGLTTGPSAPWKLLGNLAQAPRLGLGYRFGSGDPSVVLTIRFAY